jgi:hypothetical protein
MAIHSVKISIFHLKAGLDPIAEHVTQKNVTLLNSRCITSRNAKAYIRQSAQFSTFFAGHSNGECANGASLLDRRADIGAVSRCAQSNQDIAGLAERLDLTREDGFETVVIAHRGQDRCVCSETDGGPSSPLAPESPHNFGGKMLRIGSAPSVTTPKDLMPLAKRSGHAGRNLLEEFLLGFELSYHGQVCLDAVEKQIRRSGICSHKPLS